MIAVDTSALMAIVQQETGFETCMDALAAESDVYISAATLAEAMIVASRRGVAAEMSDLVDQLAIQVVALTEAGARRVAGAYERWGKGVHAAGLNLGDCFAYALAQEQGCALLFVGDDFRRTDIQSVI